MLAVGLGGALLPAKALAQQPLWRAIPKGGERLPIVGLGTWQAFDIAEGGEDWSEARQALASFLRSGGRVIDSSPMYGRAEQAIGALLASTPGLPKPFLATKVWTSGKSAGAAQIEQSFRLLQTRRIDLLQVHNLLDFSVHMSTLRALKEQGRIRYIGATHYNSGAYDDLAAAIRGGQLDFVQLNYSVGEREAESRLLPLALERRVAVIVNRPFAGGGLFRRLLSKPVPGFASEIGCKSWAQLLLKYVLASPAVTCAIPGTRNPRHVLDNLGAASRPLPDARMRQRILAAALD